ncbi:MAG: hypothetical protein GX366_01340 [Epulopiscium sp.]|nr:hypothetical protein [Candidatus Epulonipiscium sp.]
MKTIKESIKHGVSLAYISLLSDLTNLLSNPFTSAISEIDEDLGTIINDLKDYYISLDTLVGGDTNSRNQCASKLQDHHKILESKFKTINAYSRELSHISAVLENQYYLITTDPKDIEGIDYHQFIHEGLGFIEEEENLEDKVVKRKEFLRLLPMRMTKDSFNDYVEESLNQISISPTDIDNKLFFSVFTQLFDGRVEENYGIFFTDIYSAIEDLRNSSQSELSGEDIEELFDDIYLLKDTTDKLYDTIATLHKIVSSFSILLILDNITLDILFEEHVAYKDLFYVVKSLISQDLIDEEYSLMVETLPDRLSDVFNQTNHSYSKVTKSFYDKLDNKLFPETSETMQAIKVFSLIQYYLMLNAEDAFMFYEMKDSSYSLDKSTIESSISFLNEKFDSLPAKERKLRMQYLISCLPVLMDNQEFASYFNNSIEGTSNPVHKAYILAKISNYMDSFGFFDEDNLEYEQPQ